MRQIMTTPIRILLSAFVLVFAFESLAAESLNELKKQDSTYEERWVESEKTSLENTEQILKTAQSSQKAVLKKIIGIETCSGFTLPPTETEGKADPIIGRWKWFNLWVVDITDKNFRVLNASGSELANGTWKRTVEGQYQLIWLKHPDYPLKQGKCGPTLVENYVDTLKLKWSPIELWGYNNCKIGDPNDRTKDQRFGRERYRRPG